MLMVINGSKWTYIFNYPFTLLRFSARLYWIAIIYHHFLGWVPISSLLFSIYFIVRISHKSSPWDSTLDWIMDYNIYISYHAIIQQQLDNEIRNFLNKIFCFRYFGQISHNLKYSCAFTTIGVTWQTIPVYIAISKPLSKPGNAFAITFT